MRPSTRAFATALTASAVWLVAASAVPAQTTQPSPTSAPTTAPTDVESTVPPADWIAARVSQARAQMQTTPAGQLAWASIEAHGGLERWFSQGALRFRFDYRPVGDRPDHDTVQVIDLWSSRARHQVSDHPEVEFGWSGQVAWLLAPEGAEGPGSPRFWALTPYYFVGIPFVLADPGTILTLDGSEELEGRTYDRVRATYEAGTGDAPDDYYVVLIDRETRRVGGVRYIVSYPGFFPEGGHTDEKLMTYDGQQVVNGLLFAETYRTFSVEGPLGPPVEIVTNTTLSDVEFVDELAPDYFEPPAGAYLIEGY